LRPRPPSRVGGGLPNGQPHVCGRRRGGGRSRPRGGGLLPRLHLYVAPRLVRERAPDAMLSHFVHIPWPQPDYWRVLPETIRRAIHDGLLANDLVSFHTERWCRNFLRCCEDILGAKSDFSAGRVTYQGRTVLVHARPISVDPAEFAGVAESESVLAEEKKIAERRPEQL